ncbi:DNA-binding response regulator [Gemmiger sp. An120]|uniref:response regulator transcription factor n=1 Tax=Gemmiger TaxID=204475 RepID=UPI000B39EE4C|nr:MULTISPECIES: response regulator transcription factor [Gemmiger]MBM6915778.1 response regulator transcription factor [Gemmiger formicilis]OUQ41297.1 DNA-binding response regulator [Gemmiger sp. An120]HIX32782.1 response regulator transcription factor [Candidatus Gemmiger avium]
MGAVILIAEDDGDIRGLLRLYLEGEGFRVVEAADGQAALDLARTENPDMAILDVMMPQLNGYEVTRALRRYSDIPILILSAKSQDNDKILGLNLGADDYVAKPFNPVEIVARVKAQLRRAARTGGEVVRVGDLALDLTAMQLEKAGMPIPLTPMEYKILAILMRSPGRIFTKVQLYEGAAGEYFEGDDNTIMVHISKLRDKIEDDPKNPRYIRTVRGLGYRFEK